MPLDNPNIVIPDDLTPGMLLNFLEEAEEELEEGTVSPEMVSYLLQLVRHLMTLSRDTLSFVEEMDEEVQKLQFSNPASKLMLRHELKRYPMSIPKEASKIIDRLYKTLDAKPKEVEDATEALAKLGKKVKLGEHEAADPFV
jgi:hypothetical protein